MKALLLSQRSVFPVVSLGIVLIAYANLLPWVTRSFFPNTPGFSTMANLSLLGLLLLWARHQGLSWAALGIGRTHWRRSALYGLLLGTAMALPAMGFFAFPVFVPGPLRYEPVTRLSWAGWLWWIAVDLPLRTVALEEVAFRGFLLAQLLRLLRPLHALLLCSAIFVPWHFAETYYTIFKTEFASSPALVALALVGGHGAVFVAGLLFAWVRYVTMNLAGSILAHWVVEALMISVLFFLSR